MAENKKSFLFYTDWKEIFENLSDKDGAELIRHILRFVNDENPETDNPIVKVVFIPIKNALKRDLMKWEDIRKKRSDAGKASANKRQQVLTSVESVEQTSTNPTVSVSVNDNVSDIKEKEDIVHLENSHPADPLPESPTENQDLFPLNNSKPPAGNKTKSVGRRSRVHDEGSEVGNGLTADYGTGGWPTFDNFWDAYKKKIGRGKAEKKWNKISISDRIAIMNYIPRYITSQPDNKFRKNPETFFNNRSWEDEIIGEKDSVNPNPKRYRIAEDQDWKENGKIIREIVKEGDFINGIRMKIVDGNLQRGEQSEDWQSWKVDGWFNNGKLEKA